MTLPHICRIAALALMVALLVAIDGSVNADDALAVEADSAKPEGTPSATVPRSDDLSSPTNTDKVARLPLPHTIFPERPRTRVITYTVGRGDNISLIAAQFGLSPDTIVWSNREHILDGFPIVRPGLDLVILPVNGVYHSVGTGETATSIAAVYGVEPAVLYNEWNDLEPGRQPREGQALVVPGGRVVDVDWKRPPTAPAAGGSEAAQEMCSDVSAIDPGANGWFTYPTGSPFVSGWHYHDPRNPMHVGVDYACALGDPVHAADNGIVTAAELDGGYGILVQLDHGNGFRTRYGHFESTVVECGQLVKQGDLLGYCGSTGWSSGPHLHFEIRYYGVPRDPTVYLPRTRSSARVAAPPRSGQGWFAEYYNGETLTGSPVVTRYDSAIGFEWRTDGPAVGVWCDAFSVRWTTRIYLDAGHYRFCAMSDDGVRIWVGGQLVLNEWHGNNGGASCGDYQAWSGTHVVRVEYYEHGGEALIYVWWTEADE